MTNNYQISDFNDFDNFNLSDSESNSELDSEINKNLLNDNKDFFDNLQLQYFPDPYNSIGQFILSSVVGIAMMYINKRRSNLESKILSYDEYLDTYFTYCNNTTNDSYLNELLEKINLIDTESDKHREKILKLLNGLKKYSKEINNYLFENNIDKLNEFIIMPDTEFNLDSVSVVLIQLFVPLIKFTKLMEIY